MTRKTADTKRIPHYKIIEAVELRVRERQKREGELPAAVVVQEYAEAYRRDTENIVEFFRTPKPFYSAVEFAELMGIRPKDVREPSVAGGHSRDAVLRFILGFAWAPETIGKALSQLNDERIAISASELSVILAPRQERSLTSAYHLVEFEPAVEQALNNLIEVENMRIRQGERPDAKYRPTASTILAGLVERAHDRLSIAENPNYLAEIASQRLLETIGHHFAWCREAIERDHAFMLKELAETSEGSASRRSPTIPSPRKKKDHSRKSPSVQA